MKRLILVPLLLLCLAGCGGGSGHKPTKHCQYVHHVYQNVDYGSWVCKTY